MSHDTNKKKERERSSIVYFDNAERLGQII